MQSAEPNCDDIGGSEERLWVETLKIPGCALLKSSEGTKCYDLNDKK